MPNTLLPLALVLSCLSSATADAQWHPLRGGRERRSIRALQQTTRGLRVRVFNDVNHIMWDKNQGADTDLTPANVNNWIVSLDGVDVGSTMDGTGLVFEEASGNPLLQAGANVCVRPPSTNVANEASCATVGIDCEQTKWSINATQFPYRDEVVDNPNYDGVVWYDGPDSEAGTVETWWKVYVKDFCYTLRETDFITRDLLDEAWIRFSLVQGPVVIATRFPTGNPSDSPSMTPSDVPSFAPSDVPSAFPSDAPSLLPSAVPSDAPSLSPSDVPSRAPTLVTR
ncbi:hypothetical protein MPSEU_000597900 [Mayamaea pseudoterrestris]|nr:hypothetical protein MPSEU_000597900 [Mayamaea pseudoterrestris]